MPNYSSYNTLCPLFSTENVHEIHIFCYVYEKYFKENFDKYGRNFSYQERANIWLV